MHGVVLAAFCAAVGAGACIAIAGACLPDAPDFPTFESVAEAAAPFTGCGDGIIASLDDGGDAGETCDPGSDPSVLGCTPQCTISCGGVVGPSGHCYFLADPAHDYQGASINCGGAQAHVVTIDSDDEARLVRTLVGDGGVYRIGLNDDLVAIGYVTPRGVEPGWPQSDNHCPGCYARGTDDGGIFPSLVDSGSNIDGCLVAGANDGWFQIPCVDPTPDAGYQVVCEREPAGQRSSACGGPLCMTLPATAGHKRYVISLGAASADEAAKFCADFPGGTLVTIASNQEREQLARELRTLLPSERGSVQVWIGLTRKGDTWQWDDKSDAAPPWAENEPAADGTGRAFMRLDENVFDTQLVKTDADGGGAVQRIFVCQRPAE